MGEPTNTTKIQTTASLTVGPDEVCKDERSLHDKEIILKKHRTASMYNSVADTFQFLAALMLTTGMAIIGSALKDMGISGAISSSPAGVALVGAAMAATAIVVTAKFIGARHASGAYFDQSEINAQHNARYIADKFEKRRLKVVAQETVKEDPYPYNVRADGRSWVSVMRPNMTAPSQEPVPVQPTLQT